MKRREEKGSNKKQEIETENTEEEMRETDMEIGKKEETERSEKQRG